MVLSVVFVDGLSNKKLKNRTLDYFYVSPKKPHKLPHSILLKELGINVLFLDKGMIFDAYKELPMQKKFMKNCVSEIFDKTVLAYHCSEECDWLSDIKNIQMLKI